MQIKAEEFLLLARQYLVLDVRSPGEYAHAHIPGAYNLPLFSDEERKVVGTIYKQQGREQAIKTGLDYFGVKMRGMVEEVENILNSKDENPNSKTVLVHCWRGGMRSAGVSWLLGLYGFKVYTLEGGYQAFRNWVLAQFGQPFSFSVIGGYTGSGKTEVLKVLAGQGRAVIDLEGIACHKGSAFGGLGEQAQPGQEMFENTFALQLHSVCESTGQNEPIWIEDESRRIGQVNIPGAIWERMQQSPIFILNIPFEERLDFITARYGAYDKEELIKATERIKKRLGGLAAKNVTGYLTEGNYKEAFRGLLNYYDKYYERGLNERDRSVLQSAVACAHVDAINNSKMLLDKQQLTNGAITGTGN